MSKGVGGPPFLRDGPLVPYGPPTLDLWGTHRCSVARHVVATHRWNPGPENLAADQMMLFPPRASPVGRLGTDFALGLLPSGLSPVWLGYQPLLSRAKMPAVASCGPLRAPPQQAAQYPERARRARGTERRAPFGEKGLPLDRSGLYH